MVYTETVLIGDTNATLTGNTVGEEGAPEFRFEHTLAAPVNFSPTVHPKYWIIFANFQNGNLIPPELNESFLWSASSEGDDLLAQDNYDGAGFTFVDGPPTNAAFEFYGQVPAPGPIALLGLASFSMLRRRR